MNNQKRERIPVQLNDLPYQKQIWIYYSAQTTDEHPTKDIPIIQSYVDIFIGGCFQIQVAMELTCFIISPAKVSP